MNDKKEADVCGLRAVGWMNNPNKLIGQTVAADFDLLESMKRH